MAYKENELEDFEAFLEPEFQPSEFANDLIVATNGNDCDVLDLVTPIKKLKFDIEECNRRMVKITSNNYESLVGNFQQIESIKQALEGTINPSVDRVSASFDRIHSEVIKPFDESVKVNQALKKIHQTLDILRGSSFYLILIQQLQELERGENVVKLARLHIQLTQIYQSESSAHLLAIKLIRNFQPIQITKKNKLVNDCTNVITNEINHHATFTINNHRLQSHLQALYILQPEDYFVAFERASINRQIQTAVTQLQRAIQSPRNFTSIISDIKENNEEYFDKLAAILKNCTPKDIDLYTLVIQNYNNSSLHQVFWERVTIKFKKNLAATMARGGPTATNLKLYSDGLKKTVVETFKDKYYQDLLLDSLDIIQVMNK